MKNVLQVAVGVIKNSRGEILITKRDESAHQGGLWEFPGGKIEPGETVEIALARELKEELDITVEEAHPLIEILHDYEDLSVRLIVRSVEKFSGKVTSCEGQPFKWVPVDELIRFSFPEANHPIITAVRLPAYYAILDDGVSGDLWNNLERMLASGIRLIQARLKTLSPAVQETFLERAVPLCGQLGAELLLNSSVQLKRKFAMAGMHLTSLDLMVLERRPERQGWIAASCHSEQELKHAEKIGVDFVVLAPVLPTATHPNAGTLGWDRFAELVGQINIPVFALGGIDKTDLQKVRSHGGHGVAGIRTFLS